MIALIIGLGSIGFKHVKALLFNDIKKIYALRSGEIYTHHNDVINITNWNEVPKDLDFVIISNPTSKHYESITRAVELNKPIFIEKPPLMNLDGVESLISIISKKSIKTYVAFNLRFHPIIHWIKTNIKIESVLEAQIYCGSYLPNWRDSDYRESYSASSKMGGGVHLDLIHELDYLIWIFGNPIKIKSSFRKISKLEIDSVDSACYNAEYKSFNAHILLNYFRRDSKRSIEIVFETETWHADLIKGTIKNEKGELLYKTEEDLQFTYNEQMKYFLKNIKEDSTLMNSLPEALLTLKYAIS